MVNEANNPNGEKKMDKTEIVEIIENAKAVKINGNVVDTDDLLIQPDHVGDLRDQSFWRYEDIETCAVAS